MAAGTIVKGFPLLVKTARKVFTDAVENKWQEVVFMDSSGEMLGHIAMEGNVPWKSKDNLCIMQATLQDTDERGRQGMKLVVTDCFDTATPFTYDQGQEMQAGDWKKMHEDEIKGKCRYGLVCACINANFNIFDLAKGDYTKPINSIVDFIMTGE